MKYITFALLFFTLVFGFSMNVYAWAYMGDDCASCHGADFTTTDTSTDTADQTSDTATDTADQASDTTTDTADQTSDTVTDTATDTADQTTDTATDTADQATDTATDTADQTTDTATDTADQTTDTATDTADQTTDTATDTADTTTDTSDQTSDTDTDSNCGWDDTPIDWQKACLDDGSCKEGTLSIIGNCFPATAANVKILAFPDGTFDSSMVTAGNQEACSSASVGRLGGRLKSPFCGLCPPKLIGDDYSPAVLSGGTHLIVIVIDNEPAMTDNVYLSDIGSEDMVAYTTVVVDGNSYKRIKYDQLTWTPFQ